VNQNPHPGCLNPAVKQLAAAAPAWLSRGALPAVPADSPARDDGKATREGKVYCAVVLGERYRRLVKRRSKLKALVAAARTILVIIWHLLADPAARYHDLGAGYYASRIDTNEKTRNRIRQLEALGFTVTITPAA
jgi:hypothetical protein